MFGRKSPGEQDSPRTAMAPCHERSRNNRFTALVMPCFGWLLFSIRWTNSYRAPDDPLHIDAVLMKAGTVLGHTRMRDDT